MAAAGLLEFVDELGLVCTRLVEAQLAGRRVNGLALRRSAGVLFWTFLQVEVVRADLTQGHCGRRVVAGRLATSGVGKVTLELTSGPGGPGGAPGGMKF
jgi:hypothetical protein